MPKAKETVLEINLANLAHNYQFLKSKIQPKTKFLAVVKAFAYGSDAVKIAQKLETLGTDYLSVAYAAEGVALRQAGIKTPILVLHPLAVNFDELLEHQLEPSLYSPSLLNDFFAHISTKNITDYPVHLKFNTGLNRLGFWENDVDFILDRLKGRTDVKVASIFSHLAASDDKTEEDFTKTQIKNFNKIIKQLDAGLGYNTIKHILNTSGILNYPEAQLDMVRSGIGLYGFGNDAAIDKQLKPVASLKTVISQIHKIEPNESVGYNRAFKSTGYQKTATLPIGHADGIGRIYGNGKGFVFVNNKKAQIIGNTCMDMIMVDITGIDCKTGDEVVLFDENHTAEDLANAAGTISYELVTGISQRVKRMFVNH